jgi:phosphopantetheinyl transferase (holo-ACP synthase)
VKEAFGKAFGTGVGFPVTLQNVQTVSGDPVSLNCIMLGLCKVQWLSAAGALMCHSATSVNTLLPSFVIESN